MSEAEAVFAVIAPLIRAGKQPGSIAAISGLTGIPQKQTRDALFWMTEQGWILRWRDGETRGPWQYSLPAEEYKPEDAPDAPLVGEVVVYASEYEDARYGLSLLSNLNHVQPKDRDASIRKGYVQAYQDERRRYNTVHSQRQGKAEMLMDKDALRYVAFLHRDHTGMVVPGIVGVAVTDIEAEEDQWRAMRKPRACEICKDVYFERNAEQRECYACEQGLPLAG